MRTVYLLAFLGLGATASAQPTPPTPAPVPAAPTDLDKKSYRAAYDAVAAGSTLFNAGNPEGCLRVYEGALMALAPFLEGKPELMKMIGDKMAKANGLAKPGDKAFALREALDAVMGVQAKPVVKPEPAAPPKSTIVPE